MKFNRLLILCTVVAVVYVINAEGKPPFNVKILISMLKSQGEFFEEEIIKPYAKKEKVRVGIENFENVDSISWHMGRHPGQICVVKVPFDKASALVEKGLMRSLDDFLTSDEIVEADETYLLSSLGKVGGKQYYLPRKFETRIMVYLKSKVADAVASWREDSINISNVCKKYNGYGLPINYTLEEDPNKWDFYDVLVVGLIWKNTPYNDKKAGRIGHRSKQYSGTALRVIDRAFSLGADSAAIVRMSGDAVTDAFYWETVYAASGCYCPKMRQEQWSGLNIWEGFRGGDVFLSFMTQLDCFMIHGTGRDEINGYIANPEDLGYATMPAGCSFDIGPSGAVLREGSHAITTGGWWWGIPKDSPDPRLSYSIISTITNTTNQVQESNRFGMVPVRKDILSDMTMLYGGGWITEMYNVSFMQIMSNKKTVLPSHPRFDQIRNVWLDAWVDIVIGKQWSSDGKIPDRRFIEDRIRTRYGTIVAGIK
jgi:ABC-type glycerol-3-phosphate transport system substrate-binding protein